MSTPNPLAPQGSLLEQQAKGRSTFHVISFIGAVHVMLLCGILWTACSKDEKPKVETPNTIGGADPYAPVDPIGGAAPIGNTASNIASASPNLPATPPGYGAGAGAPPSPAVTVTPSLPPGAATTPAPGAANPVDNAPTPAGDGSEYKVVTRDIGESIAKKHGVTMKSLAAANPDVNWNRLKIGKTIKIPAASAPAAPPSTAAHDAINTAAGLSYTVKAGDTGMRIAAKLGVKWRDIRRANSLKSDALHPGQKLAIPGRTGTAPGGEGSPAASPVPVPAAGTLQPTAIPVPRGPGQ